MALTGTKALLVWTQRTTDGYRDVSVTNMQKSWKDGLAFCAILHHYRPDLIDFNSLSKENVRENNTLAFDIAERELGIPALLDPDDMAIMRVPDKLSIMTYVSQYYNYFKDKKPVKDDGGPKARLSTKRRAGESPLQHLASKQPSRGDNCAICDKKVYLMERQVADGKMYHRSCFRCTKCSTTLRPGAYKTTDNPKQFECMHHGDNIWKLRSDIASRASKEKKQTSDGGSGGIWETQPGIKSVATKEDPKPSQENSIWVTQQGLKPVNEDQKPNQGKPVGKPSISGGGHQQPQQAAPNKPIVPSSAVPMHPHLLASKAARDRFNSPVAAAPKTVQQPETNPFLSSPETAKKMNGDGAKDAETRIGLLASLAAVRGNVKAGLASKENLIEALEGNTGRKLADKGDSRDASPFGSRDNLLDPNKSQEANSEPKESEKSSESLKTNGPEPPTADSHNRDSGHTTSDVLSLTSLSSISQMGNSETSSVDAEQFASEIEPGKRSSGLSSARYSSEFEGAEVSRLNLSDSFIHDFHGDKIEGDTASTASGHEAHEVAEPSAEKADDKKEASKESPEAKKEIKEAAKETPESAKETPKAETESGKLKKADVYDESLNPFGDDDDGDEKPQEPQKEETGYKNPFDESDSEEDTYDDALNPFGDADDDGPTPGSPITQWPPLPAGISIKSEIPGQQLSYKVKTRQEIIQEMQRERNTLKKRHKRRAPPRPESPAKPTPSDSTAGEPVVPLPKSKKTRPAPNPPKENGQSSEAKPRPDRPPPFKPSANDTKPVPSPRIKKHIIPAAEDSGRISPVPSPRRKRSDSNKCEESTAPVPSPRQRRATDDCLDRKKGKPPRPTSAPPNPPNPSPTPRKRAPAPPPIKREVGKDHTEPSLIMKELKDIEIKQCEKEAKGVILEKKLREDMKGNKEHDNEDLLIEWFALVNEKNQLLRREGELVAQAQMQDLELQHAKIEYELRCLMHKHEHQKTDADVEREEKLLEMLVDVVTKRSQIVERLEDDRQREEAEDQDIQIMMEQSGLDKKQNEKKKYKKKKGIGLLGK